MRCKSVSALPLGSSKYGCANSAYSVVETPKPKVVEDRDVILKVTGSTICGSDLHLLHGRKPDWPQQSLENLSNFNPQVPLSNYKREISSVTSSAAKSTPWAPLSKV